MAVVIPSWNGRYLLETVCLPALSRQTLVPSEVIVVDNGSSDGTAEYLRIHWPTVSTVEFSSNHGFAGAVNAGILQSNSELIAIVNNDVELHPRWLEEIVNSIESHPDAGSIASKILDFDDRSLVSTVGDCVSMSGDLRWLGFRERDHGQYDEPRTIFSACAAAALYRRSVFEDIGLFDEDFFAYLEDVDWGFRAQLAGHSCWLAPAAIAFHINGATSGNVPALRAALLARNTYWLILKNFPLVVLRRHLPRISIVVGRRFYRLLRNDRRLGFRTLAHAMALTPRMLKKRRQSYARRMVSDGYISALLEPPAPLRSEKLDRVARMLQRWRPLASNRRAP